MHPKQIKGRRFKALDRLIADLAQIGSLERALVIPANRESGVHNAKSNAGVRLQRSAIRHYAKQIIALTGRVTRLQAAAAKPLSGLRAKANPKQPVAVDFADLLAGDRDLAAAMRPSARCPESFPPAGTGAERTRCRPPNTASSRDPGVLTRLRPHQALLRAHSGYVAA